MISVILPAYNEEKRIAKTLDALCAFMESTFSESDYEILAVNDGSCDNTAKIIASHGGKNLRLLSYTPNRGKGGAVKYGVEHAVGEIILFTDADLPYAPENIKKAVELFEQKPYDLILGNRQSAENGQKYPWYRSVMSHCFSILVDFILHLHVPDSQCGFKCFRREAAKKIFAASTLTGWGFDVELIFLAQKYGFQMGRLPVKLYHENSDSKIRIVHDTLTMIHEVRCVKKNNREGVYDRELPL